jgi:hypothetical protein
VSDFPRFLGVFLLRQIDGHLQVDYGMYTINDETDALAKTAM